MSKFQDRVAIVTASAGAGIGQATARTLAEAGASIVIADIHEERTQKTADKFRGEGFNAIGVPCDVSDYGQVKNLVDEAEKEYGRVDVLVNNAGVNKLSPLHELEDETWNWIMGVNLKGAFHTCKAVLPGMIERAYGRIVNISSIIIWNGSDEGQVAYATAKAGIVGFTRCLATEVAQHGILVNCVAPGPTFNPFLEKIYTPEQLEDRAKRTLLGRWAETREIANSIAFLASDDASYVTGSTLAVSGGSALH